MQTSKEHGVKAPQSNAVQKINKYKRYDESMKLAGYVKAPRGYCLPDDAQKIKAMLVKKTDGDHKIKNLNKSLQ